ncbi:MAG: DUF4962 domain-containing protein [Planctomycetota bacterium]|jgi:hypothetical protein
MRIVRGSLLFALFVIGFPARHLSAQEGHQTSPSHRLDPIPKALEKVKEIRPRVILTPARVAAMRKEIKARHTVFWGKQVQIADWAVENRPPAYKKTDSWSGNIQGYQRPVSKFLPDIALAYLLSGERKYLQTLQKWALTVCRYPTWGLGKLNGVHLTASCHLLGLSLIYDWCHGDMDPEAREVIRTTLRERGAKMFEAFSTGASSWHNRYLVNIFTACTASIGMTGLALYGEDPDAPLWIGYALEKFKKAHTFLGSDGASHEGVSYWSLGTNRTLIFVLAARDLLGVDLLDHPWWRNTTRYLLYMTLPRSVWTLKNHVVDIGDCRRNTYDAPDSIVRGLARLFRDPVGQWLGDQLDAAKVVRRPPYWMNLAWRDPELDPKPPSGFPTFHHFTDLGIVSARTDWSGTESLLVFKCGPFMGHKAMGMFSYNPAGGHMHPDANHFSLFGAGEWLLRDDGYTVKLTGHHNTLLINGRGQIGEGGNWFDCDAAIAAQSKPRVDFAVSSPELDQITGDATEAYAKASGLKKFIRHLLFLKPDGLVVLDDIAMASESDLELRFHPESPSFRRDGTSWVFEGVEAELRFEPLTAAPTAVSTGKVESMRGVPAMFALRIRNRTDSWRNAVVFRWGRGKTKTGPLSLERKEAEWIFREEGKTLVFDWHTGKAKLTSNEKK